MATVVTYNGVELHNLQTKQYEEDIVYDPSGTDFVCKKVKMRFSGILHRKISGSLSDSPAWIAFENGDTKSSGDTVALFNSVRPYLNLPRRELKVEVWHTANGSTTKKTILHILPAILSTSGNGYLSSLYDVENGPKPQVVSLTQIAGDTVFRLEFAIDCVIVESPIQPYRGDVGSTLSNRWSVEEEMDDRFFITRTINGTIKLSAPWFNGHAARKLVIPMIEYGFRRDRMHFKRSEDGLTCEYTVVDKQVRDAAPWPGAKMNVIYKEYLTDGLTPIGEMFVRMDGSPDADPNLMIAQAIRLIDTRLNLSGNKTAEANEGQSGWSVRFTMLGASITEIRGEENAVEVQFKIQHKAEVADKSQEGLSNLCLENFGKVFDLSDYQQLDGETDPYNYLVSREPEAFGYTPGSTTPRDPAWLYAMSCYLQDPWSDHKIWSGENFEGVADKDTHKANEPIITHALDPNDPTGRNPVDKMPDAAKAFIYTYCRMNSRYIWQFSRVQCPIAKSYSTTNEKTTDSSVVLQFAAPVCRREIEYDAERMGKYPDIPNTPDTYTDGELNGGITCTLLYTKDNALPPTLGADMNQKIYRISGTRIYALSRPPLPSEPISIGVLPITNLTLEQNKLTREDILSSAIGP